MIENNSFIVYENKALSNFDKSFLEDILNRCSYDKRLKVIKNDKFTILKIVGKDDDISLPHNVGDNISVNVFNQREMRDFVVNQGFDVISDNKVIDTLYLTKDMSMFEMFTNYVSFNAVFGNSDLLVINGKENNLFNIYYGFSRIDNSIMFSNNKELLCNLCTLAYKMPFDSYYLNDEIISLKRDIKKFVKRKNV